MKLPLAGEDVDKVSDNKSFSKGMMGGKGDKNGRTRDNLLSKRRKHTEVLEAMIA